MLSNTVRGPALPDRRDLGAAFHYLSGNSGCSVLRNTTFRACGRPRLGLGSHVPRSALTALDLLGS